jgi:hypothetical protein
MANVLSSNPAYFDTDTTFAASTNWRGVNGGSSFVGNKGIRPAKIIVTALGATTAGLVTINEINSTGGGTGAAVFKVEIPTAAATASGVQEFDFTGASPGWHDFIVTGVTAAGVALEIYYRV